MVRVEPAPSNVRENTSRPIWSQPKGWAGEGGAFRSAALMAEGSKGVQNRPRAVKASIHAVRMPPMVRYQLFFLTFILVSP